jgi:hypothetical protein
MSKMFRKAYLLARDAAFGLFAVVLTAGALHTGPPQQASSPQAEFVEGTTVTCGWALVVADAGFVAGALSSAACNDATTANAATIRQAKKAFIN